MCKASDQMASSSENWGQSFFSSSLFFCSLRPSCSWPFCQRGTSRQCSRNAKAQSTRKKSLLSTNETCWVRISWSAKNSGWVRTFLWQVLCFPNKHNKHNKSGSSFCAAAPARCAWLSATAEATPCATDQLISYAHLSPCRSKPTFCPA